MSSDLKNDRFLRALRREPVDTTPVWIMRQAGRYLPEYREVRKRVPDFMTLCRTPELACEVTLQPLDRFPLDAAILFSDILTIPEAMGLGLSFVNGEGPKFERCVRNRRDVEQLPTPDPQQELRYVMDAVSTIRNALGGRVPLIGFAGSPWTLACYMVEGGSSKDFATVRRMQYAAPEVLDALLEHLASVTADYLEAQAAAGAQALMLFDTWGGLLSGPGYERCSLRHARRIFSQLAARVPDVPLILFTKGGGLWLEAMAESGCDAVGLDWTVDIGDARRRVGEQVALQGNLDPTVLHADKATIREQVALTLEKFGPHPGHVFNLGHGIDPGVHPDHLGTLIDAVHEFGARN